MITPESLAALREKALAATPGPWEFDRAFDTTTGIMTRAIYSRPSEVHTLEIIETPDNEGGECIHQSDNDAEYIAAANPQVILSLLDEIERLRKLIQNPDRPAPLPIDDKYFESRLPPKLGTSVCQHGTPTDQYCKICKDESRWKESP